MNLGLLEITRENWEQCVRLKVPKVQASYMPSNLYSLAESKFYPDRVPLGIYDGAKMVGLVVCSFEPESGRAWIHRIMIDAQQQGKGYTRATVRKSFRRLANLPGCKSISVDYPQGNDSMETFYLAMGFKATEETTAGGNVIVALPIAPRNAAPPANPPIAPTISGPTQSASADSSDISHEVADLLDELEAPSDAVDATIADKMA